jgi:hypothetical protein
MTRMGRIYTDFIFPFIHVYQSNPCRLKRLLFTLVPTRHARRYTNLDVGRNKPVCALSAGLAFPALRLPETPTLANAGRSYSGLHPSQHPCPNDGLEQTCV